MMVRSSIYKADIVGIDFIKGLLNKSPEERFSMRQALEHPWLAQAARVEHSPNRLGGDSVWSIESFDPNQQRSEVDEEEDAERWSRPMTASGTNFESDIPSDRSFSQPMGNLKLNTPRRLAGVRSLPSPPLTAEREEAEEEKEAEDAEEAEEAEDAVEVEVEEVETSKRKTNGSSESAGGPKKKRLA